MNQMISSLSTQISGPLPYEEYRVGHWKTRKRHAICFSKSPCFHILITIKSLNQTTKFSKKTVKISIHILGLDSKRLLILKTSVIKASSFFIAFTLVFIETFLRQK